MSKLFITGINGFVGSTLANYFCSKGYAVSGLGRQKALSSIVDVRCGYVYGDIQKNIPPITADVVIHAAALGSDTASFDHLFSNNVTGTSNVLDACQDVKQFIQISTSSVYGFGEDKMRESDAGKNFDSLSHYGQTKYIAEKKVREAKNIQHKTIFRPHAIYGVNDRLILPRLLKLKKGKRVIVPRHITSKVTLTNVSNLVRGIELSLNSPEPLGIYNVCDNQVYDLKEIILELLSEATGQKMRAFHVPKFIWETVISLNEKLHLSKDISRYASEMFTQPSMIDISHLTNNLGFIPDNTSKETFKQIGKWIEQRGGYKSIMS